MDPTLRYELVNRRHITQSMIDRLHAGTDRDSVFLSSILKSPMYFHAAGTAIKQDGSLLGRLWAAAILNDSTDLFDGVEHVLADYLRGFGTAVTLEERLERARKWKDPTLYDRAVTYSDHTQHELYREAAIAGSPWGMFWYSLYMNDIGSKERRVWYYKAYDYIDTGIDFLWDCVLLNEDQLYARGRLLHAIGSTKQPNAVAYYLKQRDAATSATLTGMMCLRRGGLIRDVYRMIGRMVFYSDAVYGDEKKNSKRQKRN